MFGVGALLKRVGFMTGYGNDVEYGVDDNIINTAGVILLLLVVVIYLSILFLIVWESNINLFLCY